MRIACCCARIGAQCSVWAMTLHPENGVLFAEIVYSAPVPMVGGVAKNMVAGARFGIFRQRVGLTSG